MAKITIHKKDKYFFIDGIDAATADDAGKALIYSGKIGRMFLIDPLVRKGTKVPEFFLPEVYLLCLNVDAVVYETWMNRLAIADFKRLLKEMESLPEVKVIKNLINEGSRSKIDYRKALSAMRFTPLPHQAPFLEMYVNSKAGTPIIGSLLNAAAGTGKTYMSLAIGQIVKSRSTLIVSPNQAIKSVWGEAFGSGKDGLFVNPKRHWSSKDSEASTKGHNYFIVHYQFLGAMLSRIKRDRIKIDYVIIDESHNFSNVESRQTMELLDIIKLVKPKDVLPLSGTPIKAMSKEVASVFSMIDPTFTDESAEIFKSIYGGRNNGSAVNILKRHLGMVSYIIEKKELKLKEPIYEDRHLVLPDIEDFSLDSITLAIREYIKARRPVLELESTEWREEFLELIGSMYTSVGRQAGLKDKDYNSYIKNVKIIIKATNYRPLYGEMKVCAKFEKALISVNAQSDSSRRLREIRGTVKYPGMVCVGEALGKVMTRRRIECFKSMAREIDFDEAIDSTTLKTVVFTSFVEVAEVVYERMQIDREPLRVYGQYTKDLAATVKMFGENQLTNPLIATYASLSTAVPLVMANTEILIDLPFREYTLNQAISRVHRIGNTTGTFIYKFTIGDGFPENVVSRGFDIISWAKGQAEEITGVRSPLTMLDVSSPTAESISESMFDPEAIMESSIESGSMFDPMSVYMTMLD